MSISNVLNALDDEIINTIKKSELIKLLSIRKGLSENVPSQVQTKIDALIAQIDAEISAIPSNQRLIELTLLKNLLTASTAGGGSPSGAAGGSLSGTYPNPAIASGVISNNNIANNAAIELSKIAGLGTIVTQDDNNVNITGGNITGVYLQEPTYAGMTNSSLLATEYDGRIVGINNATDGHLLIIDTAESTFHNYVSPSEAIAGATISGQVQGTINNTTISSNVIDNSHVVNGAGIAWSKIDKTGALASEVNADVSFDYISNIVPSSPSTNQKWREIDNTLAIINEWRYNGTRWISIFSKNARDTVSLSWTNISESIDCQSTGLNVNATYNTSGNITLTLINLWIGDLLVITLTNNATARNITFTLPGVSFIQVGGGGAVYTGVSNRVDQIVIHRNANAQVVISKSTGLS